jgi:glyoxylase-like metal-dependent hydrolase (beta-lactamase superfamily II)
MFSAKPSENQIQRHQMALKAAIVPVTPFQQNCTLLFDETTKSGVVVDPGGDLEVIEDAIKQIGMTVEGILLTHGHIDHAGAATDLATKHGLKITGPHLADKFLLDGLAKQAASYGFPGMKNVTPDRWLNEGDTVTVANVVFNVLHCPGHSPGSVVFVNKDAGIALVGDVIFQGSIGRTDFPYGDHDALINAIRTKLFPLGDEIVFICGHGPASSFGRERETNPFCGDNA